jgi:hypothetical protein
MLKSCLLGKMPCNVDKIFRKIKQFGFPARQGGGVCGIEMALWDLAGKRLKMRKDQGFTWPKMDLGIDLLRGQAARRS